MIDECFYKKLDFDFFDVFLVFSNDILDEMYMNDVIDVNVYVLFNKL